MHLSMGSLVALQGIPVPVIGTRKPVLFLRSRQKSTRELPEPSKFCFIIVFLWFRQLFFMRIERIIRIFVVACLLSCKREDVSLDRISSFIRTEPERALYELEEYRDSLPVREFNRAYYALLYSEALDRCYIDIANDSIIRPAAEYFGRKGPDSLRVKSWYYLGLVQKNAKDYAGAIFTLSKAERIAEAAHYYHYHGLVDREIALLYDELFSDLNAARYMNKAVESFDLAGSEYHADYSRLLLAKSYIELQKFDECDSLLNGLIHLYQEDSLILADIYRLKSFAMLKSGMYDAKETIKLFNKAKSFYQQAYDRPQLATMAIPFEILNLRQAADSCITKAYSFSYTKTDSAIVDYEKHLLLKKRALYREANDCLEKAISVQDSILNLLLDNSIDYAVSELNKHEYALEKTNREKQLLFLLLLISTAILVLLLLATVIVILIKRIQERNERIRKYRKQAAEARDNIEKLTQRILQYESDLQELHDNLQQSLDRNKVVTSGIIEQIKERVGIIQTIMHRYDALCIRENNSLSFMDKYEALETIIREHHDVIGDLRIDSVFVDGLEDAINTGMDNVMSRVRSYFGNKVKEEDYHILVCTLAGLQPKATSFVTGISNGAVRTKKSRWLDKIDLILDNQLKQLLKQHLV